MGRIVINTAIDNTGFERGYAQIKQGMADLAKSSSQSVKAISAAFDKIDIEGLLTALKNQNEKIYEQKKIVADLEAEYKRLSDQESGQLENTVALTKEQEKLTQQIVTQKKAFNETLHKREELDALIKSSVGDWNSATNAQVKQDERYVASLKKRKDKIAELSKQQEELAAKLSTAPAMEAYKIVPQLESANQALMDMIFSAGSIGKELEDARIEAERLFEAAKLAAIELTPTVTEEPKAPIEIVPEVQPVALDEVAQDVQQALETEAKPEIAPEIDSEAILPAANQIEKVIEENTRPVIKPDVLGIEQLTALLAESKAEAKELDAAIDSIGKKQRAIAYRTAPGAEIPAADIAAIEALDVQIEALYPRWAEAEQAAARYQARINEIQAQPIGEGQVAELASQTESAGQSAAGLVDKFKSAASKIGSFAKQAISGIGKIVTKVGSGIQAAARKVSGFMKRAQKDTGGLTRGIEKTLNRIKQLAVSVLVFNLMRSAFKDFRDYVEAALLKNKQFVTAMGHLKGAAKSAFQPILNQMIPALTQLVSWLATAISYVARFIQVLSGQAVTTKDNGMATKALTDDMDGLASSTKKAGDAAKKSLAAFDLIQQLPSTAEAAGGGAAADTGIPTLAPIKIDTTWIDEFVRKLKDIKVDYDYFYNIGRTIAQKVADGLNAIPWAKIQAWAGSMVTKIAAFLNGAIENREMWRSIGNAFGDGFNTAILILYTWFNTINWLALGANIALSIKNAIRKADWNLVGLTLSSWINHAIYLALGFVSNFPWVEFGTSIGTAINNMIANTDWEAAGIAFSRAAVGIFNMLTAILGKVKWKDFGEKVRQFLVSINWGEVWDAFKEFVGSVFTGLGEFIAGLLDMESPEGVIDGLKVAISGLAGAMVVFGAAQLLALGPIGWVALAIAGLSAAVAALVINWDDLIAGIDEWSASKTFELKMWAENVKRNLDSAFLQVQIFWIDVQREFAESGESIKTTWGGLWDALIQNIESWSASMGFTIKEGMDNFKRNIAAAWLRIQLFWIDVKSEFSKSGESIKNKMSETWDAIVLIWNGAGQWFKDTVIDPIAKFFTTLKTNIVTAVSTAWSSVVSVWTGAKDWFYNTVLKPIADAFDKVWVGIKSGINAIIDGVNWMIRGVQDGINGIARTVNALRINIPKVEIMGQVVFPGATIGPKMNYVYLDRIPRLATGAVIPPNKEFLAMLGDQTSGKNIETPESLMRQIMREEIANAGGGMQRGGDLVVPLIIDGREMGRIVLPWIEVEKARQGNSLSNRVVLAQ